MAKAKTHVARLPGKTVSKRSYVRQDEFDDTPEHTLIMHHNSRYWEPRVDEADAFGPVTVYDAHGQVVRIISKGELVRPWQERQGNTWNNSLFPKRISDKV